MEVHKCVVQAYHVGSLAWTPFSIGSDQLLSIESFQTAPPHHLPISSTPTSPSAAVMAHDIDLLLRQVPDQPETVVAALAATPDLAAAQDANGYSLLHAAASYNRLDLLRTLVRDHHVDVNIRDADAETPLFAAETLDAARCLVEELGADTTVRGDEGATAEDNALANMDDGDGAEWALIADYLERRRTARDGATQRSRANGHDLAVDTSSGDLGDATLSPCGEVHPPPPLPPNVRINVGTMHEEALDESQAPDPEFRRRIEELASRDDFHGEDGQRELRRLVQEAMGGLNSGAEAKRRKE